MGLRDRYLAAMHDRCAVAPLGERSTQHMKPLLHVAPPNPVQQATQAAIDATRRATNAQQKHGLPGVSGATLDATTTQRTLATHATGAQHVRQAENENEAKLERIAVIGFAAWTDTDMARFLDRRTRLMRWGWAEPEAEQLAERLVKQHSARACTRASAGGHDEATWTDHSANHQPVRPLARPDGLQPAPQ